MKVLMITGDKKFAPGYPRYDLQASAVETLAVVYWGRGSLWPKIPAGRFDVVTAQDPFWRGLFAWRVARKLGAKFNAQVHTDLGVQSLVRHILAQIVLRHADSVRVVSEKIKKQVMQINSKASVHVLPIFVDIAPFAAVLPQSHAHKMVLWIGRFEPEKDPMLAIDVIRHIPEAKLVMLGNGNLEGSLRAEVERLQLADRVEFPGWQDPAVFLAQADVVLCTSKHESYGASMIEALAAGVPVVAPDVGVAREAGAIVVPRPELASAVIEVLQKGIRGELKLPLLSKEEWVTQWKKTL